MGLLRALWEKIRPSFWDQSGDREPRLVNYRRLWKTTFGTGVAAGLVPLLILTLTNFYQFEQQYQLQRGEIVNQVHRLLSNTKLQVSYFLQERQSALQFIVMAHTYDELSDKRNLSRLYLDLKQAFGGFVDLGLINSQGIQVAYTGPYNLEGRTYSDQDWYKEILVRGAQFSEVFLGHRQVPHMVVAVKHELRDGTFYILRATIDTERINGLVSSVSRFHPSSDAFIVNEGGVLQTPSVMFGHVLDPCPIPVPKRINPNEVMEITGQGGQSQFVAFTQVDNTPFVVVMVKQPEMILQKWGLLRVNIMVLAVVSAFGIVLVLARGTTNLINRLYEADQRRVAFLHQIEYTNKLASIGRLAAGVAHEINNPLAIINEKAGLLKDLIAARDDSPYKDKFQKSVESILKSVKRVSAITHRLLGFARHLDVKDELIHLEVLIQDVLGFLGKEAEYRNVAILVNVPDDLPAINSDLGQLQQVFLNIINNALDSSDDGGKVEISAMRHDENHVAVRIADQGCGIPPQHLRRIFEPFYSTKGQQGTGLGLSITYGIVQKLGGSIEVSSKEGEGSVFTVILPLHRDDSAPVRADHRKQESELL